MKIQGSVALVTGANRGLGLALAKELIARGAKKVYAGARDPSTVKLPGVVALRFDVTKPETIAAAVKEAGDVDLFVNNAGIATAGNIFTDDEAVGRAEMETNYFGLLRASRAFAPVLAKNGGGAFVNILSIVSWLSFPHLTTYSASKSAAWAITNGLREALRSQKTQVLASHPGYIDTEMTKDMQGDKATVEQVAKATLDALEAGEDEVVTAAFGHAVKQSFAAPRSMYLGAK